jgi:hypothetical protein
MAFAVTVLALLVLCLASPPPHGHPSPPCLDPLPTHTSLPRHPQPHTPPYPTPASAAIPAHLKAKGWSDARAFAATQLLKSPNTYFYRHVAPHQQQAQGEWTPEEHAAFLATAAAHGVGDKWGLFASYLPQRVGYQCSAYYRCVCVVWLGWVGTADSGGGGGWGGVL